MSGLDGADELYGMAGAGPLRSGDGDYLFGGVGNDILDGRAGADNFRIEQDDGRDVMFEVAVGAGINEVWLARDVSQDNRQQAEGRFGAGIRCTERGARDGLIQESARCVVQF